MEIKALLKERFVRKDVDDHFAQQTKAGTAKNWIMIKIKAISHLGIPKWEKSGSAEKTTSVNMPTSGQFTKKRLIYHHLA